MIGRGVVLMVLGSALTTCWTTAAWAHSFEPAVLNVIERESGVFDVSWTAPSRASGFLFDPATLRPQFPPHCRRGKERRMVTGEEDAVVWRIDCGAAGLRGGSITVDGFGGSLVDVVVRLRWRGGNEDSAILRRDATVLLVPGGGSDARGTALTRYATLGIEHILLGYDHLAFVLGLFALARGTRELLTTVTGFTLGHSLTLSLATLQLISLPQAYCEALIALSIVYLGRALVRDDGSSRRDLTARAPWLIATAFGLLHGLGFAGALGEIGFEQRYRLTALFGFNLGVEIGQLAFVGVLTAFTRIGRRWVGTRRIRWRFATGYALGSVSVLWLVERVRGFAE